jgi:STE24 endopeptidase
MPQFLPADSTPAYLAQIPPDVLQRATDYTHGNHWLILFSAVVGVLINVIVLRLRVLERLRARWERKAPRPWSSALLLSIVFYGLAWLLDVPWSLYAKWWRPVQYGLSPQSAGAWLAESAVSAVFSAVLLGIVLMLLYALIRRAPRTWWIWSSVVTSAMIIFAVMIAPVVLEPVFNHYQPLAAGPQRDAIAAMAAQAGIPPDHILSYDGSKQSANYTANVAGMFGSARIAVSDALLNQASTAELRAVVGHEIGHYVLHHALLEALLYSALLTGAFLIVHLLYAPLASALHVPQLGQLANPAGLPVLTIILTVVFLLLTPVTNGVSRYVENQADIYSLAQAREPDGMAIALLRTADYRAPSPGIIEEWLFYDHPSIARRIQRALDWKHKSA